MTPAGAPRNAAAAAAAIVTLLETLMATTTRSRRYRSPRTAPNGAATTEGRTRRSPTRPTAAAPPCWYAYRPSVTMKIQYAHTVPAHESSTRRRLGFPKTDENASPASRITSRSVCRIGSIVRRFVFSIRAREDTDRFARLVAESAESVAAKRRSSGGEHQANDDRERRRRGTRQ